MKIKRFLLLCATIFLTFLIGQNVQAATKQLVIIGDSRTEDMHLTVGDSGCVWSYEVGSGIYWMMRTGAPAVESKIGKNTAVVILLGVNDAAWIETADVYLDYINAKANEWASRGAVTYYFSVTPINEATYKAADVTNAQILAWNKYMKNGLSSKVKYVNIYPSMLSNLQTYDGLHYRDESTIQYFNLIKRYVNGFDDVQDTSHPYYTPIYWATKRGITNGYPGTNLFGIDDGCTRSQAVMFLWKLAGKPAPKAVSKSPFKDVTTSLAHYKAILWAYQNGITKGYGNGLFGVDDICTRGQICTFIWRYKGKPAPSNTNNPFTDSITGAYKDAVLWAAEKGVTKGFPDGTFRDSERCTRGQCMTFIYRIR